MQSTIRELITKALTELGIGEMDFSVEHPADLSHGDYATNAAMIAAKQLGTNPKELAGKIVVIIEKDRSSEIEKIEIAGPGFINFYLSREFFKGQVADIIKKGEQWGKNDAYKGKRIMVEYTQPNPFKPFHIGHLMSNAIGESLSRLIEASGAEMFRANYQGDVGLHIGKALWGLRELGYDPTDTEKLGEAYAYGHAEYEKNDVAKKKIVQITKQVYAKDPSVMDSYTKGREASLEHFDELYARLGSHFDGFFFEGEVWEKGKEIVEAHIGDIFEKSEGAVIYRGEQDGLHTRVFINSEGVTTYEAKDVGLAYAKRDQWPFDVCIYVTAVEQDQYFKVVFKVIEKMDAWFSGRLTNVAHGMMQLADGKMSSRKGNVITGESMLDETKQAAYQKIQDNESSEDADKLADVVGVAALKYMILKQSLGKNIVYDPAQALSFEGDSGPYLQYTHARASSVLEKAEEKGVNSSSEHVPDMPYVLEKVLYQFPEVVHRATEEREPHHLVTYLTELAGTFNTFYAQEKIADPDDEYAPYKAVLADAVRTTLANGLWMLGIKAPERM